MISATLFLSKGGPSRLSFADEGKWLEVFSAQGSNMREDKTLLIKQFGMMM